MAAVSVTEPEGDEWLYELKLDGYRALLLKDGATVRLLSRNEKELTRMYRPSARPGDRFRVAPRSSLRGSNRPSIGDAIGA